MVSHSFFREIKWIKRNAGIHGEMPCLVSSRSQWCPICGVAFAWAIGIAHGLNSNEAMGLDEWSVVTFIILVMIVAFLLNGKKQVSLCRYLVFIAFFTLGSSHSNSTKHTINNGFFEIASLCGDEIIHVEGVVDSNTFKSDLVSGLLGPPPMNRMFQTANLRDVTVRDPRTNATMSCADIQMKIPTSHDCVLGIRSGDRIKTRARILFDQFDTNLDSGFFSKGEPVVLIEHPSMIDVICRNEESITSFCESLHEGWSSIVSDALDSSIEHVAGEDERTMIRGIVLGNRGGEFESLSQPYRRTGTSHYLAVSGFAIGVLAAIPMMLVRSRMRFFRSLMIMSFLVAGILAIDLRSPAIRSGAVIMLATMGFSMGRHWSKLGLLAVVSIIMLAINPKDIMNPGFQLSFTVVASLMTLAPIVSKEAPCVPGHSLVAVLLNARITRDSLACGLMAWIASFPIVIHHFGVISPIGILASIVLMPVMAFMIGASVISIMMEMIMPSCSWIPGSCAAYSMRIIEFMVSFFDSIPGSFFVVAPCSLFVVFAFEVVLWRWFGKVSIQERLILLLCGAVIVALILLPKKNAEIDGQLRMVTMDMGNGTCHLLMTDETNLLFDGGSLEKGSCGRKIILPVLKEQGVQGLDCVVISHANVDHFSGLSEIIGRIPIGFFVVGESFIKNASEYPGGFSGRMLDLIESWRVPILIAYSGTNLNLKDLTMTVHHPQAGEIYPRENDNSLVVSLNMKKNGENQTHVLLTGDIEELAMKKILFGFDKPIQARIMEVPHHGSVRRSSRSFIEMVKPEIIVQSTGIKRLREDRLSEIIKKHPGITRFSTALHGLIQIDVLDSGVSVETRVMD